MRTANVDTKAKTARRGFTLIEAIVVIVILGVLAAVVAPRILNRVGDSKQSVATSNAATLFSAMKTYIVDNGMPESGATIDILWEKTDGGKGPYVDVESALSDPWGNKYILQIPPARAADFEIVSFGKDGQPGGEGEDADIIKP